MSRAIIVFLLHLRELLLCSRFTNIGSLGIQKAWSGSALTLLCFPVFMISTLANRKHTVVQNLMVSRLHISRLTWPAIFRSTKLQFFKQVGLIRANQFMQLLTFRGRVPKLNEANLTPNSIEILIFILFLFKNRINFFMWPDSFYFLIWITDRK